MNVGFEEQLNLKNKKEYKPCLFDRLSTQIKQYIFLSHYLLLINQFRSFSFEILMIMIKTIQILAFALHPYFKSEWKPDYLFNIFSNFFEYFQLVIFFTSKTEGFFIFYYFAILVVLLCMVIEWIIVTKMSHKGEIQRILISSLQITLYMISNILFIPIIKLLLSIFQCIERDDSIIEGTDEPMIKTIFVNKYATKLECWNAAHYVHISIGMVFLIIFLCRTLLFVSTYFEPNYDRKNPIGKLSSKHELIERLIMILYLIMLEFICTVLNNWILVIVIMILLSLVQLYTYYNDQPHYNKTMLKLHICAKIIGLWSFICLFLGKILSSLPSFNCNLILFLLGIPIIFLLVFTREENTLEQLIALSRDPTNGENYAKIAYLLLDELDSIDSRSSQIVLPGYAFFIEASCTLKECALKQYIKCINHTKEATIFLLAHIESLYELGIHKYPFCISLRLSYCRFLIERLTKKQFAYSELNAIDRFANKLEDQFIIYRYKKIYNDFGYFNFNEKDIDANNALNSHNSIKKFQALIVKVSLMYIDFWTLLYQNHIEHQQDLSRLNEIGTNIQMNVKEIHEYYIQSNKTILNEKEMLLLYYDFASDILHDNSKRLKLKGKLTEMQELLFEDLSDQNIESFDTQQLSKTDKSLYMIVNGQYSTFGIIINISLSLCSYLGYTKEELCGVHINDLLPSTIRKGHDDLLKSRIDAYMKKGNEYNKAKLEYHDVNAFVINKSKYLLPFGFKQCFMHTENKQDYWIIKVFKENNAHHTNSKKICHVITDQNMIIQHFTGNSMQLLGLNSFAITNTIDITKFIKEFYEEFLHKFIEQDDKSNESKCNFKRQLIKSKYKTAMAITWKKNESSFISDGLKNGDNKFNINDSMLFDDAAKLKITQSPQVGPLKEIFFLTVSQFKWLNGEYGFLFKLEQAQDIPGSSSFSLRRNILTIGNSTTDHNKKRIEYNSNSVLNETYKIFEIDKSYLPIVHSNTAVIFDPKKTSYYLQNNKCRLNRNEIVQYLKKEATDKLNDSIKEMMKNNTEEYSEENTTESYPEDYSSCDYRYDANEGNEYSSSIEESGKNNKMIQELKNVDEDNSYYNVNMAKIKYSVIEYKHNSFIDVNYNKISYVQQVLNDLSIEKNKTNDLQNEVFIQKQNIAKKDSDSYNTKSNTNTNIVDNITSAVIGGKKILSINKQIEDSLSNKESQETIIKLGWFSALIFLIVIINHGIFLMLSIEDMKKIRDNINQIELSYDLIKVSLLSMFHIREVLYLNFDNYKDFHIPKDEYRQESINELGKLYLNFTAIIDDLSVKAILLTQSNYNILYNNYFRVDLIENTTEIFSYQLTLISSFSKLSTALYQVTQLKSDQLIPTNPDVFFFTRNIINYPFLSLLNQTDVYKNELENTIVMNKIGVILAFTIGYLVLILSYAILRKCLDNVMKRKESYLEVFFEIGSQIILSSLHQCYSFAEKIQNPDGQFQNASVDFEEEYDAIQEKDNNGYKSNDKDTIQRKKTLVNKEQNSIQIGNNSKEGLLLKIRLISAIIITVLLASITLILFILFEDTYTTYVNIYIIENQMLSNVLFGFNIMRDYLFDVNAPILGMDMNNKIHLFYEERINVIQKLETAMRNYSSEYSKSYFRTYFQLHHSPLYNFTDAFFDKYFPDKPYINSKTLLSNSSGYGISLVLSTFFVELNDLMNLFFLYTTNKEGKFEPRNNTLYGTKLYSTEQGGDGLKVLSSNKTKELVISLTELIIPIYTKLIDEIVEEIDQFSKNQELLFIMIEIIFILIACLWFGMRWRAELSSLNQIIYKTKNMLTIIPIDVLASLSSIHKVLNIKNIPLKKDSQRNQYMIPKIGSA